MAGGWLRFDFLSDPSSGSGATGATIDDIVVTGYEFGPVNNLTAARQHGNLTSVDVKWDAPYQRGTTTPDARDIWYRVWRHDVSAGTWTEVTSSRIDTRSFTDTGVSTSGTYEYVVQGWESSGSSTWGQNATSSQVGPALIRFDTPSITPTSVGYKGGSTLSATLVDEIGDPIAGQQSGIVVQRQVAGGSWTTIPSGVVSEITSGTYSALVASTVSANYRLYYASGSAASAGQHVTATAFVSTPGTPISVKHAKAFNVTGTVSTVPGHARTVTLRAYHKETKVVAHKKTTVWVQRAVFTVAVAAGDSVVSYRKSIKLSQTRSWRINASVSDAYNASATSAYRSFVAK
jgi:hypothetical protein